jgi:phage shock protein A
MAQELPRLSARLEKARSVIAELAQSRKRVQAQMTALEQQETKLAQQAVVARKLGREDLALKAKARQQEAQTRRAGLAVQLGQLLDEEAMLTSRAQRLQAARARIYWFGPQNQNSLDREDPGAT